MLAQLLQSYVRVVTNPSVSTFEEEKPGATLTKAVVGFLVGGLVSGVFSAIGIFFGLGFQMASLGAEGDRSGVLGAGIGAGVAAGSVLIASPILSVLMALLVSAWLLLWARILGGRGSYTQQTYLLSLVQVPLGVVSAVVGLVPCLGALVGLALWVYGLVLSIMALMSAHGVSAARGVGIAALAAAVPAALACCVVVGIAVLAAAA